MTAVSDDLAWWRAHRDAAAPDGAVLREVLARLRAWKAEHDQDRTRQMGFLRMAWDAIFSDEDDQVGEAIRELEDALSKQQNPSAKTGGAAGRARP